MEDIDGGLHPAVDGQSLGQQDNNVPEACCLPLSESEGKRGGYVIPKYALCNGSKDES